MLKTIKKLKNAGVFQDYTAKTDIQEFSTFNLVYGWNGSGKTTLTRVLNTLNTKVLDTAYPDCEFEMIFEDKSIVKQSSLDTFKSKLFVFNQPFIEDNIDWKKQGAKSIVVIAEDKIEERNRFFELKDKLIPQKQATYDSSFLLHKASEKERDDFLTGQARSLKQSFQLIDTSDRRYLNYDRSKLRDFIAENIDALNKDESILSPNQIDVLRQKVRPIQKPVIEFKSSEIEALKFTEGESKISDLLKKSVTNQIIQRLLDKPDINQWVSNGLSIHTNNGSQDCEFCGKKLDDKRIKELEAHFNKDYSDLINKLSTAKNWVNNINLSVTIPDSGELYDELQTSFKQRITRVLEEERKLQQHLEHVDAVLASKIKYPFDTDIVLKHGMSTIIESLNKARSEMVEIIHQHNKKTNNFEKELTAHKKTLELHYVAEAIGQKKYFDLLERIENEEKEVVKHKNAIVDYRAEIAKLESSLGNVARSTGF